MAKIEYFYSAHSAFAYLGSARFMEIARAAGRSIVHKPVDLRRVVAEAGAGPAGPFGFCMASLMCAEEVIGRHFRTCRTGRYVAHWELVNPDFTWSPCASGIS